MKENKVSFNHIKPYLYILAFIAIPVLALQFFKSSNTYSEISKEQDKASKNVAIVIHGGAGNFSKKQITDSAEILYRNKLQEAIALGNEMLAKGDSAINIVPAVINVLENSPLFNAGKGSVFTHDGTNELDASIMDGLTMNAGAVAGVSKVKNPINLAKEVMLNSEHVLLSGKGAEQFAQQQGVELVDPKYFYTEKNYQRLQEILRKEKDRKYGTVGCVVLDEYGNIVAGTSTGGMTNKKYGRIGDSPIIGAGTYANNKRCGISATGHGEYFIRYSVAHDISARQAYLGESLQQAAALVIGELKQNGGNGGVIGIDTQGNIMMEFNTTGMFRAYSKNIESPVIKLFSEE